VKVPHFTPDDGQRSWNASTAKPERGDDEHPNICPVYDVGQIGGVHYWTDVVHRGSTAVGAGAGRQSRCRNARSPPSCAKLARALRKPTAAALSTAI